MKKAGVIGGMGPLATVQFFNRIVERTQAHCDQEHINLLISNHASLPDRTQAILNHEEDGFLRAIGKDFDLMNRERVECIAIPCNTSHSFYEDFLKMTDIPIINMVEETVQEIEESAIIFGTRGTLALEIYQRAGRKWGKNIIVPHEEEQVIISKTIENVKNEMILTAPDLEELIKRYRDKHQVILACTELSCLHIREENRFCIIDAMDVLTKRLIQAVGKTYREKPIE